MKDVIEALFFIPVGPNDAERVLWTVQSIRLHCQNYRIHLIIDGIDPLLLSPIIENSDVRLHVQSPPTRGNGGEIWLMYCTVMSETLEDETVSRDAVFVKMDADALVIRPGFEKRAQMLFATRPGAGQLGQCFSNILGNSLSNFGWENFFRKIAGWRGLRRCIIGAMKTGEGWRAGFLIFSEWQKLIRRATNNGYRLGTFVLGGCFILRREVVEALKAGSFLRPSPLRFLIVGEQSEDVIMTMYVYAVSYAAMDDVSDGGIFAIEGKQFRLDPFVLKSRGHFIIHPTKYGYDANGYRLSENELIIELNSTPYQG